MSAPPAKPGEERSDNGVHMEGEASGHGRVYQAGGNQTIKVETQTVLSAGGLRPIAEVEPPPGLVGLQVRPGLFVGRVGALAELDTALVTQTAVVLGGLGGIGKSTLAARYAATHANSYNAVWALAADSPSAVNAGLAALAVAIEPELAGALPLEALTERAVQWLAAHDGWLTILDNVNHPADIEPLLARAGTGRLLITSRLATGWHRVTSTVLRLDVFEPSEAVELLTGIVTQNRPAADLEGAEELCAELGCLPLAIDQAAAYMYQAGIGPRAYLELLAGYAAVVFDQAAEGADAERTIARIWRVTLDRLSDTPLAGQILRILAWYAPDTVPRSLLNPVADPPMLQHAIGRLAAYNLVTPGYDSTLALHRLVQTVARTPDPGDPHRQDADVQAARDQATSLLSAAIPPDPRQPTEWPTWRTLLQHITALIDRAPASTDTTTTAYLLNETGLFLLNQGDLTRAIHHYQRALTAYVQILGDGHPHTMQSRNNLAGAYELAGDLVRAIPLHEQTLAERERVLGADHPDSLASRNNLGSAHHTAGYLEQAISLHERTLADCERVLGADHPLTLASRNNLASAYESVGDLEQAIPLYKLALAERERVLGADHPGTLTSRNNLANAYESGGDPGQAISLHERTLADSERVLGADHPRTLDSRNNLAYCYQAAGQLDRAIPLFKRTLADSERVLGADHRDTLDSRNNLAVAYQAAGEPDRAIPLFERSLAECERVLGAGDSLTKKVQAKLAELK